MNRNPSRPIAVLALLLLTACATNPAASGSPTGSPTNESANPTQSAPASSSADPSPSAAAGEDIRADAIVVATVDGLRIRETPGLDGAELGTLARGSQSLIVGGPQTVDGMDWYLLSGLGLPKDTGCGPGQEGTNPYQCPFWFGWAASADADGAPWIEVTDLDCPDPSGSLDAFASLPRLMYIACYGDATLTLRGFHHATPGIVDCPGVPQEIYWLACVADLHQLVSTADGMSGLIFTIGPTASLTDDLGELLVTGHFDDAAAADCAFGDRPEQTVVQCRSQFVVDSGVPVSP